MAHQNTPSITKSNDKIAALRGPAQREEKRACGANTYEAWKKSSYENQAFVIAQATDLMRAGLDRSSQHGALSSGKWL
jgi:hypothetical protein